MRALAIALILVAACGDAAAPTVGAADEVLVVVEITGGLCPEGACSETWTIFGDGRVTTDGEVAATLSPEQLDQLGRELAQGPGDLPPFTGTCPEAYDGPRFTYTIDEAVIDSCIDDVAGSALIQLIHAALGIGSPYG